jgi:hypothetical protein
VALLPELKEPAGQLEQVRSLVVEPDEETYCPAGQVDLFTHAVAGLPSSSYAAGEHVVQEDEPSALYEPAGHGEHDEALARL